MRAAWVAVFLILGCSRGGAPATDDQPLLLTSDNVTRVERGRVESGPILSGILSPIRQAQLRAQAAGEVTELLVERGQAVSAGQPLLQIKAASLKEELLSAQVGVKAAQDAFALAQKEAKRAQFLFENGSIARRDYDSAQNGLTGARAALSAALAQLSSAKERSGFTRLVAPFDGVIAERPVNVGDVVAPGMALVTVVDRTALRLDASVPAAEALELRPGEAVDFRIQGQGEHKFTGTIEWVSPAVDPQTRQLGVYVRLPNQRQALLPGLYAEGRVAVVRKEALTVDSSAVRTLGEERAVLRVSGDRVERVPVKLGLTDEVAERAEVLSGLHEGDLVIAGNAPDVSEGARVVVEGQREPGRARRPAGR